MLTFSRRAAQFGLCLAVVAAVTAICYCGIHANVTTEALMMLLMVFGAATGRGLMEAIFTLVAAAPGVDRSLPQQTLNK